MPSLPPEPAPPQANFGNHRSLYQKPTTCAESPLNWPECEVASASGGANTCRSPRVLVSFLSSPDCLNPESSPAQFTYTPVEPLNRASCARRIPSARSGKSTSCETDRTGRKQVGRRCRSASSHLDRTRSRVQVSRKGVHELASMQMDRATRRQQCGRDSIVWRVLLSPDEWENACQRRG